jgi:hypothetical protein
MATAKKSTAKKAPAKRKPAPKKDAAPKLAPAPEPEVEAPTLDDRLIALKGELEEASADMEGAGLRRTHYDNIHSSICSLQDAIAQTEDMDRDWRRDERGERVPA